MMDDKEIWVRWSTEIEAKRKDKTYQEWVRRSDQIVKRYRDERTTASDRARRLNILWSNVETLRPAIYPKMPKPIVERKFLDRDRSARMAATILERCLHTQMQVGYFNQSVSQAVLDLLLSGLGTVWLRYEPVIEADEEAKANKKVEGQEQTAKDIEEEGDGVPYEKIAFERVCVDYVFWKDLLWGSARFWCEVPWISRRCWLTTSEIAEKFYDGDMEKARRIKLDYVPNNVDDKSAKDTTSGWFKKAEVHEIWNKADQTVYFIALGTQDAVLRVEKRPELKLEGFWPTPKPLFATQTNETLVPVPDYAEYQDQAMELDDLTNRIAALTTALRVNGVYNASFKELELLLQDGQDNRLVPVEDWAAFSEKAAGPGPIWLVPIKDIAAVLIQLYQSRQQTKDDLYEVTGMSDIIRGQGMASETATAQRIKGQFASLRLEDRRGKVSEFNLAIVCIMAEIIAEMFTPESLMQMSGMEQLMQDQMRKAAEGVPPPPPPSPDQMPPEMQQQLQALPPEQQQIAAQQLMQQAQQQAMQQYQQAQQQAAQQAQQTFMEEFQQAVQILKSDKLRGFRVDIETDATIEADAQAEKQAMTELMTGTLQALTAAGPIIQTAPELMKPIGALMMATFRRFRVGRTVEATLEDALDQINDKIEAMKNQPPPPDPEQQKAQAEMEALQAKTKMEMDSKQADAALKQQQARDAFDLEREKSQEELLLQQQKNDMEIFKAREELKLERERMELERQKIAMEREKMMVTAAVDMRQTQMDTTAAERQHELDMETAEAKAEQARKPPKAK